MRVSLEDPSSLLEESRRINKGDEHKKNEDTNFENFEDLKDDTASISIHLMKQLKDDNLFLIQESKKMKDYYESLLE